MKRFLFLYLLCNISASLAGQEFVTDPDGHVHRYDTLYQKYKGTSLSQLQDTFVTESFLYGVVHDTADALRVELAANVTDSSIYKYNGSLTGDRTILSNGNNLLFDNITDIFFDDVTGLGIGTQTLNTATNLHIYDAFSPGIFLEGGTDLAAAPTLWLDNGNAYGQANLLFSYDNSAKGNFAFKHNPDENLESFTISVSDSLDFQVFGSGVIKTGNYGKGLNEDNDPVYITGWNSNKELIEIDPDSIGGNDSNIYNNDGTLTGPRAVALGGNDLNFGGDALVVDGPTSNIGIGTSTPIYKLEITDNSTVASRIQTTSSGSAIDAIRLWNTHAVSETATTQRIAGYFADPGAIGTQYRSGYMEFGKEGVYASSGSRDSYLAFATGINNVNTEHVRINSDGKVGVGTTSPTEKFEIDVGTNGGMDIIGDAWARYRLHSTNNSTIAGMSLDDKGLSFYDYDDAAYRMTISPTGNVGIGTSSPISPLHVSGGNVKTMTLERNMGATTSGTYITFSNRVTSTGSVTGAFGVGQDFRFNDNNSGDRRLGYIVAERITDTEGAMKFSAGTNGNDISLELLNTQQAKLNAYGSGTFTGTEAYLLAVEADGDIIEVDIKKDTLPVAWLHTGRTVEVVAGSSESFIVIEKSGDGATCTHAEIGVFSEAEAADQLTLKLWKKDSGGTTQVGGDITVTDDLGNTFDITDFALTQGDMFYSQVSSISNAGLKGLTITLTCVK